MGVSRQTAPGALETRVKTIATIVVAGVMQMSVPARAPRTSPLSNRHVQMRYFS
jgi:hypothetical protein